MRLSLSFFTFVYLWFPLLFFPVASSRQPLCHDSERSALLRFKESLSIDISISDSSGYPKTSFWNLKENSDCCSWDGVKCNEDTGYVIELDLTSSGLHDPINSTSTLFNLVHLQWLSLADNNFNHSKIPSEIKNLSNLSHLNLSWSVFSGQIPSEILELSKLESLALDRNEELELQQPGLESLVQKLTNLRVLDLGNVKISSSLPHALTDLSSLTFLSLASCNLKGTILWSLGNLNNLTHLDLSGNKFQGIIPSSLNNLASLVYLDMSNCFSGQQDPSSLGNLTQLNFLDLSFNNFSRPSSSLSWIGKNTKLAHLGISGIHIGEFPFWLMNLNKLSTLYLSYNQLSGHIPSQICNLTQLKDLDLSSNQFQLPIPSSFVELNNLETLDLSSNNLSGTMELKMFLQLKSLRTLYLSSNHLSLLSNLSVNTSSHKFLNLGLGSCNLRSFPDFLRYQDQLDELDLSSNNISGQIPGWLFNLSIGSLTYLNLSQNLLTGFDQQPVVLPWTSLYFLDLSFNKLQGPLPISPVSTIEVYLVSNNNLSGELSPWICKLNSLQALDLSHNYLSGKLPQCLGNFSHGLLMLNLQNNKFNGSIPQTFMKGTELRMIDLSNNMLRGKISRSLANCTKLVFLDLGNNKINDTFPSWIGNLPNLVVLNLQSNMLYGAIEERKSDFKFPKLQIIDLSHNRFTGKLPSNYFACLNAMKVVNASQLAYMMKSTSDRVFYDYSLTMVIKGIEIEYVMISTMLVSISLSNNRFEGEIPASISILQGLRYLNLSNNNLVGGIPSSLGNLTVLESLDLSNNNLSQEIPPQLVKLTPLAFFNVSYNNFTGPIPHGAQFDTFNNMSYEGNPGLCGPPLSRKCGNSELPHKEDNEGSESPFAFGWKVVAIGYASGLVIGVVLEHIFCTKKYEWFVKIFRMPLKIIERKRG